MSKDKSRSKGPMYRRHTPTDTARCWLDGKWKSLGKYNSPESHEALARVLAEFRTAPLVAVVGSSQSDRTVDEVALAFWTFAEGHYRRADGTQTNELTDYRLSIRALRKLYGSSSAAAFGPKALKAVRQTMVDAGLKRATVNARVRWIKLNGPRAKNSSPPPPFTRSSPVFRRGAPRPLSRNPSCRSHSNTL